MVITKLKGGSYYFLRKTNKVIRLEGMPNIVELTDDNSKIEVVFLHFHCLLERGHLFNIVEKIAAGVATKG